MRSPSSTSKKDAKHKQSDIMPKEGKLPRRPSDNLPNAAAMREGRSESVYPPPYSDSRRNNYPISVVAELSAAYRVPVSLSDPTPYMCQWFQPSPNQQYQSRSYPYMYPPMHMQMVPQIPRMVMGHGCAPPMQSMYQVSVNGMGQPGPYPQQLMTPATAPAPNLPPVPPRSVLSDSKAEELKVGPAKNDKPAGDKSSGQLPKLKPKSGSASTYKHRNVYKSVIRHMYSYIRRQRNEIVGILQTAGFNMHDVEHAFYEIGCYNDMERQKGKKKISQSLVKRIATDKSIYTYILRETLNLMLKSWDDGKFGRLTKRNITTYRDVCQKYYNETARVLAGPAQGAACHP